ncbi:hypothetical protein [Natrinema amylolyticum]|uniref:hypothetical protein n=1 Tax=Natrinema amylolyticum TaxID=2878679 RepID=UPI003CCE223A
MQTVATREVSCPHCGERASVSLPGEEVDVKVRKSVAAFGEYTTVTCSEDHSYWVYFC